MAGIKLTLPAANQCGCSGKACAGGGRVGQINNVAALGKIKIKLALQVGASRLRGPVSASTKRFSGPGEVALLAAQSHSSGWGRQKTQRVNMAQPQRRGLPENRCPCGMTGARAVQVKSFPDAVVVVKLGQVIAVDRLGGLFRRR